MRHSTDKGGVWSLDSSEPAAVLQDEEVYETEDVPKAAAAGARGAFVPWSTQPLAFADTADADGSGVSELDADGATAALARTRLRARLAAGGRMFAAERYGDRLDGECFCIAALDDGDDDGDEDEDTVCCPSCGNEFGHVHKRRPRSAATLVERYNRLQYEAAQLEADLRRAVQQQQQQQSQQQSQQSQQSQKVGASVPPLDQLADQVAGLTARLRTLPRDVARSSAGVGACGACASSPSPAVEVVAPRAARAVVHDGEDVESDSEPSGTATSSGSGTAGDAPVLQGNGRCDGSGCAGRDVALKTLGDLDRRLAVLERTVGCGNAEAALGAAPLCETVVEWRKRLLVLTAAQLEALRSKIKEVQESMAAVRFASDAAPAAAGAAAAAVAATEGEAAAATGESGGLTVHELAQVQRVLENMERWEKTRQALPEIVERLRTLAPLHEASVSFAEQLDDVESRQQAAQQMLDDMQLVVVRLEQSLALSTQRLADNVQALEARLAPPHPK